MSEIEFLSEKNENLKKSIISSLANSGDKDSLLSKVNDEYEKLIEEINENSNIQIVVKNKSSQDIHDLLDELLLDFKEQNNLKKIESLEKRLINNLDENSYSELIKLKSQLNRE